MNNPHKVYIMRTTLFSKIGVTMRNIETRVKEIQTSCPLPIHEVIYIPGLPKYVAYELERAIKEHLSDHHSYGEWYKDFDNLSKSLTFVLRKFSHDGLSPKKLNTSNNKFEDVSVQFISRIKKMSQTKDLSGLSSLLMQINNNLDLRDDERFFMYSRETVIALIENSIRILIGEKEKELQRIDSFSNKQKRKNLTSEQKNKVLETYRRKYPGICNTGEEL